MERRCRSFQPLRGGIWAPGIKFELEGVDAVEYRYGLHRTLEICQRARASFEIGENRHERKYVSFRLTIGGYIGFCIILVHESKLNIIFRVQSCFLVKACMK
jgi:hypothetical protein